MSIRVSCVVYYPDEVLLKRTLKSLQRALNKLNAPSTIAVDLIDNTPPEDAVASDSWREFCDHKPAALSLRNLHGHGNIGFGAGHNLSVRSMDTRYHLILNPDVILHDDALAVALRFMDQHPDVVLLSPESRDPVSGQLQFQCKQYPDLLVLVLRLLNFNMLNRGFAGRLARYEEREKVLAGECFEAKIVSGCFMLLRTKALHQLKGFDERFFLYFEDFDLSLRAHQAGKVVYHPKVKIHHYGGGAGRKGAGHLLMFMTSALRFFRLHGWRFF